MKKIKHMEIIGILSLSLLITSTMTVSGGIPEMVKDLCTDSSSIYTLSSIEFLMSMPAFSIMCIIAITPILSKYISERVMISTGLIVIGTAGILPVFTSSYPLMFLSRFFLGIGIGLVNTYAVTLIGDRFTGTLRQKLQGIRCSMETLGEASLIFIAGQLLIFGWHYAFLVYGFAWIILFLYIFFVPTSKNIIRSSQKTEITNSKISTNDWKIILQNAVLGGLLVSTLTANALRISSFIVESGYGSAVEGSTVLSISIFAGFVGGITFGKLYQLFPKYLLIISSILVSVGLFIVITGENIITITAGAAICGMFTTIALSHMFNTLSDRLPLHSLTTANAVVLVGCNLGSALTPLILQAIALIHTSFAAGFLAYAAAYLFIAIGSLLIQQKVSK